MYKICCTNRYWAGQALAIRLMRAELVWNHAPYLAYADRWHLVDLTSVHDVIVKYTDELLPEWLRNKESMKAYEWNSPFEETMWNTYRNNLPGGIILSPFVLHM